jgi:dihydroxyacetone kinase DhaKLM complex PTS-EIIA-like component DhaM
MRKLHPLYLLSGVLLALAGVVNAETSLSPVMVSVKGSVTVTAGAIDAPAAEQQALAKGNKITTAGGAGALISLVPGMSARMKSNTVIRLEKAEVGTTERYAEVALVKGKVLCSLSKQGSPTQRYRLDMGAREWAEAVGTMWQSGVEETKHHVAVLEGTVTWVCLPMLENISVPAGSVLLSEYEMKAGEPMLVSARVVSLVDGTVIYYYPLGTDPKTSQASAEQLKEARDVFSEAVGNQFENLKTDERAALLSLLFEANRVLSASGVAGLSAPGGSDSNSSVTSTNPADATSRITP